MKQDENTVNDFAEKIELASITNIVTKEEILQKLIAKGVVKTEIINVAGQRFYIMKKNETNQIE